MGFLHIGLYGPLFSGCEMSIRFFIDWDPVDSYREPSRRREGVSSYWGSVGSCLGLCVGGVSSYWVFWMLICGRGMCLAFFIEWDPVDSYLKP